VNKAMHFWTTDIRGEMTTFPIFALITYFAILCSLAVMFCRILRLPESLAISPTSGAHDRDRVGEAEWRECFKGMSGLTIYVG
jgi:hypothetical protein